MAVTPITLLPTAPARTDTPATFNTRADAFLGALYSPFAGEMNTSIGEFNTDFTTVATNATNAATSATASATSATASAASATAAANASDADAWVSGASYTPGDVVYSPIDFQSYRCILSTSGTTDPSANDTNWVLISSAAGGVTYVTKTGTYTTQDLEGVLADTSGGAFTVNLPASPSTGDQCIIADSGDAFGTNNLTTGRNGSTIAGTAADLELDIDGVSVQFIYDGSTWEVYAQIGGNSGTVVTLAGIQTLTNKTLTSPVLTTPALGTPSALVLTNATGTLTSPTFVTPALGTPASGVLTNATGLPNSSVIGLGSAALVATGTTSGKVPLVGTKSSTTTLAGLVERSTSAENITGTDDTVYPTVAGAKEMIDTHAGGGGLILLQTINASGASTVDLETTFDSTYDAYEIVLSGIVTGSDNITVNLRLKVGGSYLTAGYAYILMRPSADNSTNNTKSLSAGEVPIIINAGNVGGENSNYRIYVYKPAETGVKHVVNFLGGFTDDNGYPTAGTGACQQTTTGALTGVQILPASGTLTCTARLYGLVNS